MDVSRPQPVATEGKRSAIIISNFSTYIEALIEIIINFF